MMAAISRRDPVRAGRDARDLAGPSVVLIQEASRIGFKTLLELDFSRRIVRRACIQLEIEAVIAEGDRFHADKRGHALIAIAGIGVGDGERTVRVLDDGEVFAIAREHDAVIAACAKHELVRRRAAEIEGVVGAIAARDNRVAGAGRRSRRGRIRIARHAGGRNDKNLAFQSRGAITGDVELAERNAVGEIERDRLGEIIGVVAGEDRPRAPRLSVEAARFGDHVAIAVAGDVGIAVGGDETVIDRTVVQIA